MLFSKQIENKRGGDDEYKEQGIRVEDSLKPDIKSCENENEIKCEIAKKKIFYSDDPFIQPRIIVTHFKEAADKAKIKIIRSYDERLV